MAAIEIQMWLTFAVAALAIAAFSFDRLPIEVSGLAIVVALLLIFVVGPEACGLGSPLSLTDILAGFANPALAAVLALVVVGQAVFQTGALDRATRSLARSPRLTGPSTVLLLLVAAGALSAFLNNTPVVVMLVPVVLTLARERRIAAPKLLMPMNVATIVGGSTTLIGSSTNLLVAEVANRSAGLELSLFSITVPGLVIAAAASGYIAFVMPRVLSDRETNDDARISGKQFLAEITIPEGHPLIGKRAVAGLFPGLQHVVVRLIERGDGLHLPPFEDIALEAGDRVVFAGIRRELAELGIVQPGLREEKAAEAGRGLSVAECLVPPGSRWINRAPETAAFDGISGLHVAAIERRGRMGRMAFSDIRLEAGDVLLVAGRESAFDRIRGSRDLIVLERSISPLPARAEAKTALTIFALMVAAAATGLVPIAVAALVAALAMIATGCLNVRQARRAFDGRIFMLVGASIALAAAMERTGGAEFLARNLVGLMREESAALTLSALFALIALMTNVLSNNATAVLFTPIAISAAAALHAPAEPFVVAVIFAANASFATPIGYQTNLLVMGPGGYRFSDYVMAGGPLVVLVWAVFSLLAPWYYGL
ncbi:SLC13 family permease [Propylenella binzhouense]|uniref:SLC13 family permease n=1 Tax=Propylenella binzhouense TaxID=2555902 RepID=A0A964T1K4_9HYPH|nr:SLC13 family permease [Propylenella binzhouense]MYZ46693.1 SLC13 family permease [Propylenella binzhouense]